MCEFVCVSVCVGLCVCVFVCVCVCVYTHVYMPISTHSDREFSLAGAQQAVDCTVKQLVIVEADVTRVGANQH